MQGKFTCTQCKASYSERRFWLSRDDKEVELCGRICLEAWRQENPLPEEKPHYNPCQRIDVGGSAAY